MYRKDRYPCSIGLKTENHEKGIRNEIEYRLGLYFSLRSGAPYVRDTKYGDEEQVMKQLEDDIIKDIIFLSHKRLGEIPGERDFKSSCAWYRTKLMQEDG